MKKTITLATILTSMIILGCTNIAVAEKYEHYHEEDEEYSKKCDPTPENYKKCGFSAKLDIYIDYSKHPITYYHEGMISVNDVNLRFDVKEWAAKTPNENTIYFDYYFQGYEPYHSKVCIKNLDSDNKQCLEIEKDDVSLGLDMPD